MTMDKNSTDIENEYNQKEKLDSKQEDIDREVNLEA
jgi:hypothetical protein